MRSGYECFMKTWQDKPDLTRVRWFRAEPSAKFFEHPHVFGSLKTWDREAEVPAAQAGEKGYVEWTNSSNPLGYAGKDHCGPDAAMENGGRDGVDPPITTDEQGMATCCEQQAKTCGHVMPELLRWRITSPAGCPCIDGYEIVLRRQRTLEPAGYLWWMTDPPFAYNHPFGSCTFGTSLKAWFRVELELGTCTWSADIQMMKQPPGGGGREVEGFPSLAPGDPLALSIDTMNLAQWPPYFLGQVITETGCQVKLGDPAKRMIWDITTA